MKMENENNLYESFASILRHVEETKPLIHCITHPITMNDCANLVLAVGASPNMASHPEEAAEFVSLASVLAVNLGNIADDRMEGMQRAAARANELGIPILIDAVGVSCSTLRRRFAHDFIETYHPAVIKGNGSEIRALCGLDSHGSGVDAGAADAVTADTFAAAAEEFGAYAAAHQAVVLASGPVDVVTDGTQACGIANGTPVLAKLTGTGCMLGVLTAVYMSDHKPWHAAVLAAAAMGIAGEQAAEESKGMGSFHIGLFDAISNVTLADIWKEKRFLLIQ